MQSKVKGGLKRQVLMPLDFQWEPPEGRVPKKLLQPCVIQGFGKMFLGDFKLGRRLS
jgi:hypothetical protein